MPSLSASVQPINLSAHHALQTTFLFVVSVFRPVVGLLSFLASFLVDESARKAGIQEKTIVFRENIEFFNIAVIVIVVTSSS